MLTEDEIRKSYNMENDNIYLWITKPTFSEIRSAIFKVLVYSIGFPVVFILGFWEIAFVFELINASSIAELVLFTLFVLSVFSSVLMFLIFILIRILSGSEAEKAEFQSLLPLLFLGTPIMIIFVISSPLFYPDQFLGTINSRLDWLWYYFENLLSLATLNIHSHLGIKLSDISANGWIGNLMISLLRTFLASTVLYLIITSVRKHFVKQRYYGTVSAFYHKFKDWTFDLYSGMGITIEGKLVELDPPIHFEAETFFKVLTEEEEKRRKEREQKEKKDPGTSQQP